MGNTALKQNGDYTYADYLRWPEGEKIEIIDGIVYALAPAPNRQHQDISGALFFEIYAYLKDKTCKVYTAPFDVRLPGQDETELDTHTVVQPDIAVICDPNKLDDKGCKGAPDLIMEILSPATAKHDHIRKRQLYEQHGVVEYWIVDPINRIVTTYHLCNGKYEAPRIYSDEDVAEIETLRKLKINLKDIFGPAE